MVFEGGIVGSSIEDHSGGVFSPRSFPMGTGLF